MFCFVNMSSLCKTFIACYVTENVGDDSIVYAKETLPAASLHYQNIAGKATNHV